MRAARITTEILSASRGLGLGRLRDRRGCHLRQLRIGANSGAARTNKPAVDIDPWRNHLVHGSTSTGTDSPVSIEPSTAEVPSTTTQSQGRPLARPDATTNSSPTDKTCRSEYVARHHFETRDILGAELQQRPQCRTRPAFGRPREASARMQVVTAAATRGRGRLVPDSTAYTGPTERREVPSEDQRSIVAAPAPQGSTKKKGGKETEKGKTGEERGRRKH